MKDLLGIKELKKSLIFSKITDLNFMNNVFILIPSVDYSGPIKGAIALANSIVKHKHVTLISIKKGLSRIDNLDNNVNFICLADNNINFVNKIIYLRKILFNSGGKKDTAIISFCFSADLLNLFCSSYTKTISSVRGNLINIYRLDYGLIGIPAAIFHFLLLRMFNTVVAMSSKMANQIYFFSRRKSVIIENFINEPELKDFIKKDNIIINNKIRLVFVGSLSTRKKPLLLIKTLKKLKDNGYDIHLDIVGNGSLRDKVIKNIKLFKLEYNVTIHNHVSQPYEIMKNANIFILPSLSEGISRASLESLFIGLPCVLRDVDSNSDLIKNCVNGFLFKRDNELYSTIIDTIKFIQVNQNNIILPDDYRQNNCANKYLNLLH
jgi:glycosyltransferase involved in cell wall biosynthesis